jgi:energy-coupling factor transporter transmembrane protein EcfT
MPSGSTIALSRVLVPLLGSMVWWLYYLNGRAAYRLAKSPKKTARQLSFVLGSAFIFMLQVNIMQTLTPSDAHGSYFFRFILLECGGAIVILFAAMLRERTKIKKSAAAVSNAKGLSR